MPPHTHTHTDLLSPLKSNDPSEADCKLCSEKIWRGGTVDSSYSTVQVTWYLKKNIFTAFKQYIHSNNNMTTCNPKLSRVCERETAVHFGENWALSWGAVVFKPNDFLDVKFSTTTDVNTAKWHAPWRPWPIGTKRLRHFIHEKCCKNRCIYPDIIFFAKSSTVNVSILI